MICNTNSTFLNASVIATQNNLMMCSVSLLAHKEKCQAELLMFKASLTACDASLSTHKHECQTNLALFNTSLRRCEKNYDQESRTLGKYQIDLIAINTSLSTHKEECQADLAAFNISLTACEKSSEEQSRLLGICLQSSTAYGEECQNDLAVFNASLLACHEQWHNDNATLLAYQNNLTENIRLLSECGYSLVMGNASLSACKATLSSCITSSLIDIEEQTRLYNVSLLVHQEEHARLLNE